MKRYGKKKVVSGTAFHGPSRPSVATSASRVTFDRTLKRRIAKNRAVLIALAKY